MQCDYVREISRSMNSVRGTRVFSSQPVSEKQKTHHFVTLDTGTPVLVRSHALYAYDRAGWWTSYIHSQAHEVRKLLGQGRLNFKIKTHSHTWNSLRLPLRRWKLIWKPLVHLYTNERDSRIPTDNADELLANGDYDYEMWTQMLCSMVSSGCLTSACNLPFIMWFT